MRLPCRLELFDRNIEYRAMQVIPTPEIEVDYYTLSENKITLAAPFHAECGWYVSISGGLEYQGIITDVDDGQLTYTISVRPLVALFDINFYRAPAGQYTSCEGWLKAVIQQELISNSDTVERIPGLTVDAVTNTSAVPLGLTDDIQALNLWTLAKTALEQAQIIISAALNPQAHTISAVISRIAIPQATIEADLPVVTVKSFAVDDQQKVNKVCVINSADGSRLDFYSSPYSAPVKKEVKVISATENFAQKASETAAGILNKDDFANCIELSFVSTSKMVPCLQLGQQVLILRHGIAYHAVLTAVHTSADAVTYTFGRRRRELTKRLKLEG